MSYLQPVQWWSQWHEPPTTCTVVALCSSYKLHRTNHKITSVNLQDTLYPLGDAWMVVLKRKPGVVNNQILMQW